MSGRRPSSGVIQRQASVCLSDGDELERSSSDVECELDPIELSPGAVGTVSGSSRQVSALVHRSSEGTSPCSTLASDNNTTPRNGRESRCSHSSPDSGSVRTVLRRAGNGGLDLETYDYRLRRQSVHLVSPVPERSASSLDVAGEGWKEVPSPLREAASTEAGLLERGLEIHRQKLERQSPRQEDDEDAEPGKVRYYDTGSREDIHTDPGLSSAESEGILEEIVDDSDRIEEIMESEFLRRQYRELWELRATLEAEEEMSEQCPEEEEDDEEEESPEDGQNGGERRSVAGTPSGHSPEATSHTTSFESTTTEPTGQEEGSDGGVEDRLTSHLLTLPSHESRRHSYKSLLTRRLQRRKPPGDPASTETSVDSLETTEGSSTDASRGEVLTTSCESNTTTDSTGESQTHRLQQMKADSGYKSMESNGGRKHPKLVRQVRDSLEDGLGTLEMTEDEEGEELEGRVLQNTPTDETPPTEVIELLETKLVQKDKTEDECERSRGAVKKRRLYGKDRQVADVLHESTADTALWAVAEGGYLELREKTSVFHRFFRSNRTRYDHLLIRDFSVDEKSDSLFREFSRPDPAFEAEWCRRGSQRLHSRMHHHHHEGSSPRLSRKILSPQLSIEEEDLHNEGEPISGSASHVLSTVYHHSRVAIPVICLSREDHD